MHFMDASACNLFFFSDIMSLALLINALMVLSDTSDHAVSVICDYRHAEGMPLHFIYINAASVFIKYQVHCSTQQFV